ncbi:MAG: DUF58 domain-containing protein [Pirellulaceae bacterium]|nr:DUF58 domain-containing protein [Pirellulaceae bacterium]
MTMRARMLATMALASICLATIRGQFVLSLVSLSVIVWILAEWLRFQRWQRFSLPRMQFQRTINDRAYDSSSGGGTLWTGRTIRVEICITSPRRLRTNLRVRDYVSEQLEIVSPDALPVTARDTSLANKNGWLEERLARVRRWWLTLVSDKDPALAAHETRMDAGEQIAHLRYSANIRSAGLLTFPGVRLTVEDIYGLFRAHRFLEFANQYRVLPSYYEMGELKPTVKRHNSLPRHGIHRLQRSGMGSELLELREYVPGDPPKSIAWKVSARRDKLLTRQYESEVPVRVHLIVDGSIPTRIGGFGLRLLDQINYVTASVAQAAIAVGDPVDCLLVSESGVKRLPWFSGDRGMMELLKALSEFSLQAPPTPGPVTPYMKQCAITVCHERFPELLDRRYNRIPFAFRGDYRRRYRMVGVLSQLYDMSPREHAECLLSDQPLAGYMQRFLHDAGMPWMAPLLPAPDEPTKSSTARMQAISNAMVRSIMHAQDNEVFVVLADLLSAAPNLQSIERTVKLAIAKHHRVAFVCPTTTFARPKLEAVVPGSENIADLLFAAERTRVRDLAFQMKRDLLRLGAAVSFSGEEKAIRLVLNEMDTARSGRKSAGGLRT